MTQEQNITINVRNTNEQIKYTTVNVEQEIEIVNQNNKTNYIFILIQPKITTEIEYPLILSSMKYCMALERSNSITFNGYMIPPVSNYEVIDIPSILFTILTMPFAFISTAFNLTLFPGTPYQINLSNLFLTIMAILIFVFIIKMFINK